MVAGLNERGGRGYEAAGSCESVHDVRGNAVKYTDVGVCGRGGEMMATEVTTGDEGGKRGMSKEGSRDKKWAMCGFGIGASPGHFAGCWLCMQQ